MTPELIAFYVGPDKVMPLASILATIAGFLLIFWNKLIGLLRHIGLFRRSAETPEDTHPQDQSPPQG